MVLDEPKELCLVSEVSTEMQPHTLGIVMLQTVVKALVVTKVEALLLQLPFEVPVSFGNKEEVGIGFFDGRNQLAPVFCCRRLSRTAAPGTFEDRIKQQHRHVTTDAVALAGDTQNGFEDGTTKLGLEGIQLQYILPGRKIRIASACENMSSQANKGRGITLRIVKIALNEIVRMDNDPGMVRCHVIGNKIENQTEASLRQLLPSRGKSFRTAQVFVDHVAAHTVSGPHVVLGTEIGQRALEILDQALVPIGDRDAGGAPLPNPHQPHGIESVCSERIPFSRRYRA